MSMLSIENVINISVATPGAGAGRYNTSNLAILSDESYAPSFGTRGFKIYLSPSEVETDFGSDSVTYAQALAVFSQSPNILAGNGYLVIIPIVSNGYTATFDALADSGDITFTYDGNSSAAISFDATEEQIRDAILAITDIPEGTVVSGTIQDQSISVSFPQLAAPAAFVVGVNNLVDENTDPVGVTIEAVTEETLAETLNRIQGLVSYFAAIPSFFVNESDSLDAASVNQTLIRMLGLVYRQRTEAEEGGVIDLIRQAAYDKTRALYYGDLEDKDALAYLASYFGRLLSVNFNGSDTTLTMHLKTLVGVLPDNTVDQTLLNEAKTTGADMYVSIQGVPKCFISGANDFSDNVYNLLWLVGDLQISGFNLLAQTPTKIPQTEIGMDQLKKAYGGVLERAITNGFIAAGSWNSPTTFGVQSDFFDNVEQRGYYMYSQPVGQQDPEERADRTAPLIQIAIKYAGAVHRSNVIVYVNP